MPAQQGITKLVFDRLGRGESPAEGRLDLDRELDAIQALLDVVEARPRCADTSSGCSISLRAAAAGCPSTASRCGRLRSPASPLTHRRGGMRSSSAWTVRRGISHYMKDMPPEWLAEAKASSG